MKGILGGVRETSLKMNHKYDLKELKAVCVKLMKDKHNEHYFQDVDVELGNFKEQIFSDFLNEAGEKIDFWQWNIVIKSSNRQMKIYLLTTGVCKNVSNEHAKIQDAMNLQIPEASARQEETTLPKNSMSTGLSAMSSSMKIVSEIPVTKVELKSPSNEVLDLNVASKSESSNNFLSPSNLSISNINEEYQAVSKKSKNSSELAIQKYELKQHLLNPQLGIPIIDYDDFKHSCLPIGKGAYGTVYKGMWLGTDIAVKKIKQKESNKYIVREIQVLVKLRHPNVISIMAVCIHFDDVYILMEYFKSETLRSVLFVESVKDNYNLDHNKKYDICTQLCQAVTFIHSRAIVHKDIKPENILLNSHLQLKLCDMGFSKYEGMPSELLSAVGNCHGTLLYMAPELLIDEQPSTIKSDVWALACVIVEMFTEDFVWDAHFSFDLREKIVNLMKTNRKPKLDQVPQNLRRILSSCFNSDPIQRPQSSTLLDFFRISNNDSDDD